MRYWIFIICHIWPLQLWSQTISGRIIDAYSGTGIPGAYILTTGDRNIGTITNEDGYFLFKLPAEADSIKVTHIGYQSVSVPVKDSLHIALTEAVYELSGVEIVEQSAYSIVQKTIQNLLTNYSQQPQKAKGFYREMIRDTADYLSIAEAVFEILSFPGSKQDVQLRLIQGRSSENVKATRLFEDFHPGGMPQLLAGLDIRLNPPTFLQKKYLSKYEYKLDSILYQDDQKVYVVNFDQKANVKEALQQGKMYIQADRFVLIRYQARLSPRGNAYIKHLSGEDKLIAGLLNIDFKLLHQIITVDYQLNGDTWAMSLVNLQTGIAYKQPRKEIDTQVDIKGELFITELSSDPPLPLPKETQWKKSNLAINLSSDYNDAFWGQNNIISPTTSLREIVSNIQGKESSQPLQDSTWQILQPALVKIHQKDSAIYLKPLMKCEWKDENTGPMLYRQANGDFTLETAICISKATDSTQTPDRGFQAGGLLIRDTLQDSENHIFLGIGTGGNENVKLLVQNTVDGNSAVHPAKVDQTHWQLRIERIGSVFNLYAKQTDESEWKLLKTIERKKFFIQVQAGLATYAHFPGNGPKMRPDIQVQFNQTQLSQQ